MLEKCDYRTVRDQMLARVKAVSARKVPLEESGGRVLAQEVTAAADIPPFDRSPYDGYAFRAADVSKAAADHPVTLRIVDYIPAGDVPHTKIIRGTAAHLMTGAPVPEGADAVLPFERTIFTDKEVTILEAVKPGSNVIYAGEDVRKGTVLAGPGSLIDAGLAGTLAGQGIFKPLVYQKPVVGIISTGTELLEEGEAPSPGRIYNTNRYALQAACSRAGCRSVYVGTARDDENAICGMVTGALQSCDAVILSGGVSVGDFDCTPAAMEKAGVELLAHGLALKPGMAGAYGVYRGDHSFREHQVLSNQGQVQYRDSRVIPVFGLSGNPAACMTAFYAIVLPVLRKMTGLEEYLPKQVMVRLEKDYSRANSSARLLRGRIEMEGEYFRMKIAGGQGNQVLSSLFGSNAFAEIPAGAVVKAGEPVQAFLIPESM